MYATHIFLPIFTDLYASFRISSRIFPFLFVTLSISQFSDTPTKIEARNPIGCCDRACQSPNGACAWKIQLTYFYKVNLIKREIHK
jgi:hypothetical protein